MGVAHLFRFWRNRGTYVVPGRGKSGIKTLLNNYNIFSPRAKQGAKNFGTFQDVYSGITLTYVVPRPNYFAKSGIDVAPIRVFLFQMVLSHCFLKKFKFSIECVKLKSFQYFIREYKAFNRPSDFLIPQGKDSKFLESFQKQFL